MWFRSKGIGNSYITFYVLSFDRSFWSRAERYEVYVHDFDGNSTMKDSVSRENCHNHLCIFNLTKCKQGRFEWSCVCNFIFIVTKKLISNNPQSFKSTDIMSEMRFQIGLDLYFDSLNSNKRFRKKCYKLNI